MMTIIFTIAFFGLCLYAAITDLRKLIIPNWLNLTIALLFLPAAFFAGLPLETFGWHVAAGAIAFVIAFLLFATGVFGGGDAKMIPAVMLWIGPAAAFNFTMVMALAGGVLVALVIFARKTIPAGHAPGALRGTLEEEAGVPYGVAITTGVLMAGSASPMISNLLSLFSGVH